MTLRQNALDLFDSLEPVDIEFMIGRWQGDTFLVPKGWMVTWDMPFKYREMIIVETRAWLAEEF